MQIDEPTREVRGRRSNVIAALLVAVLAFLAYANTLVNGFALDDVSTVLRNDAIHSLSNVPQMFGENYMAEGPPTADPSLYRPATSISFALNYALHELHPLGWHLINVMLHALASVFALFLARRFAPPVVALAAAVLFAVHPVHTEAVANIAGRPELLAAIGVFGTLLAWFAALERFESGARRSAWILGAICVMSYALGIFSKESGIVALGMILGIELVFPRQRWILRGNRPAIVLFAFLGGVTTLFLILRARAIEPPRIAMGLVGYPTLERIGTALRVIWNEVLVCLWPARLSATYTELEVPIAKSLFEPAPIAAMVLFILACALAWRWRERVPAIAFAVIMFAVALAPTSNLLFPIGTVQAERLLYVPSIGVCVAMATALYFALARSAWSKLFWPAILLLGVLGTARTLVRNRDWRDNETLGLATLTTAPRSSLPHALLTEFYTEHGRWDEARDHAREYVRLTDGADGWEHLGVIEQSSGRDDAAIDAWKKTLERDPNRISALTNLSVMLVERRRFDEAQPIVEKLCRRTPDDPAPYLRRLAVYAGLGQTDRLVKLVPEIVALFGNDDNVRRAVQTILRTVGQNREADELEPGYRLR